MQIHPKCTTSSVNVNCQSQFIGTYGGAPLLQGAGSAVFFALEQLHFLYIARCYTRVRLAHGVHVAFTPTCENG